MYNKRRANNEKRQDKIFEKANLLYTKYKEINSLLKLNVDIIY